MSAATCTSAPPTPGRRQRTSGERLRDGIRQPLVIARRNLVKIPGDPALLLDATVMPIVFATMFVFVFGGAISGSRSSYADFFIPGLAALAVTIVSRSSGIGISADLGNGLVDRFRSLPIARTAVLTGRILADAVRMALSVVVTLTFSMVLGFRVHSSLWAVLATVVVLIAFGMALSCVSIYIGLRAKSIQTVESLTTLWMMPLQFGSSIFVPPDTMPGWLQGFVAVNPMSLVVDTARGLLGGGAVLGPLAGSAAWIAVALLVFVPLCLRQYRDRT